MSLKLSEKMEGFRCDRPSEWLMDEYIRDAKNLEEQVRQQRVWLDNCYAFQETIEDALKLVNS